MLYKKLIEQLSRATPRHIFEEYVRMAEKVHRQKKMGKNEQEYWDELVVKEKELRDQGLHWNMFIKPPPFPKMEISKTFDFLFNLKPNAQVLERKRCNCATRDLFNYGCRCGGV